MEPVTLMVQKKCYYNLTTNQFTNRMDILGSFYHSHFGLKKGLRKLSYISSDDFHYFKSSNRRPLIATSCYSAVLYIQLSYPQLKLLMFGIQLHFDKKFILNISTILDKPLQVHKSGLYYLNFIMSISHLSLFQYFNTTTCISCPSDN